MTFLIINIICFLISAIYIYKISYFYDYRYIGNVLRFIVVYCIFGRVTFGILSAYLSNFEEIVMIYSISSIVVCFISCLLFRTYLISTFGKEERFANSDEVKEIGDIKE